MAKCTSAASYHRDVHREIPQNFKTHRLDRVLGRVHSFPIALARVSNQTARLGMVATCRARIRNFLLPTAAVVLVVAGCTPVPRVELTAYTTAYSDSLEATNGVLDIVVPYERVVMRVAAGDTASFVSTPRAAGHAVGASPPPIEERRSRPRPLPPPDPTLFADPNAVRSPRPLPPPDPALFADPNAVKSVKPAPAPDPPPAAPTGALTTVIGSGCISGIGGADPFCYQLRDAWADIGDPPLVAAYRGLSNVVLRFNNLLVAYANGISGRLLEQDVNSLAAAAGGLTQLAPIAAIGGAGGFAAGVSALAPIAGIAGRIADRAQLRDFLLNNYENVDKAIALMATGSAELYANVSIGTNLFRRITAPGAGQSLVARRQEIRRLIANWTVLLDDNRRLLRELRDAAAAPDGLESRLNNLDPPVKARIDTSIIKKQIATLGTPMLAP